MAKLTIYLPAELREQVMTRLPRGKVSRICQDALRAAVREAETLRDEQVADLLAED